LLIKHEEDFEIVRFQKLSKAV